MPSLLHTCLDCLHWSLLHEYCMLQSCSCAEAIRQHKEPPRFQARWEYESESLKQKTEYTAMDSLATPNQLHTIKRLTGKDYRDSGLTKGEAGKLIRGAKEHKRRKQECQ